MGSAFDKLWSAVAETRHQEHFGEQDPITYTHDGTETKLYGAIVTSERTERRQNPDGGEDYVITRTATFPTKRRTFVPAGTVTIDSVQYAIESIHTVPGLRTKFLLRRVEARELARPGYRSLR